MTTIDNKRVDEFLSVVQRCCALTNIKLLWGKGKSLKMDGEQNGDCFGYFCEPGMRKPGILAVARGRPRTKWLSVLAHEYGHMCQWFFDESCWKNTTIRGIDAVELMDAWSDGTVELDADELELVFTTVRLLELDADAKALQFIELYKLPIDPAVYRRDMMRMDYSYRLMQRTRRWKVSKVKRGRIPQLKSFKE